MIYIMSDFHLPSSLSKTMEMFDWGDHIKKIEDNWPLKENDTIIFDSVSRMSRNAEEGIQLYMELFNKGVNLIFLKESYINTDTYKKQLEQTNLPTTDNDIVNLILDGVKKA